MQLNATEQDVSNQTKNTRNSKPYITSSRVVALFRWQEKTAAAISKADWQSFPQRRGGGGGGGGGWGGGGLTHCSQSGAS